MTKVEISKKVFNDVYLPYIDNKDRYLIFYGGGSSRKELFYSSEIFVSMFKQKDEPISSKTNRKVKQRFYICFISSSYKRLEFKSTIQH